VEPQLPDGRPVVRVRYLLERGRTLNSSGAPERSVPLFTETWEIARASRLDAYAVDAAHMLAIALPGPAEQHEWNLRAIALAEESPDARARRWLGSLYNNVGWTYHGEGRFGQALDSFERALEEREREGDAAKIVIARWCVARALRSLGRVDEALERQRALHAELDGRGESDGYVDEEIGTCLLALGRGEEAAPHFAKAHRLLGQDPWLAGQEVERLTRFGALGARPLTPTPAGYPRERTDDEDRRARARRRGRAHVSAARRGVRDSGWHRSGEIRQPRRQCVVSSEARNDIRLPGCEGREGGTRRRDGYASGQAH
jgi:tetratricopeptide (TPR) repeat protein